MILGGGIIHRLVSRVNMENGPYSTRSVWVEYFVNLNIKKHLIFRNKLFTDRIFCIMKYFINKQVGSLGP